MQYRLFLATQRLNIFKFISVKWDFKYRSYGPDTILLQGHAVILTFKVATQMLRETCHPNMVIISVK